MKSDIDRTGNETELSADERHHKLSLILASLTSIRDDVRHRPDILVWIEKAVIEAERQVRKTKSASH